MSVHITDNAEADQLLSDSPFALLVGMLLDQQIPMETAFSGPAKIAARIPKFDPATIAGYDADALVDVFRTTPAVHRFPGSMAARVQTLCRAIVDDWGGDAAAIWNSGNPSGAEIVGRLKTLPGFGEQKAKIFLALLGKQYGCDADGWRAATAPYGEPGSYRSVADVVDQDSLARVRETKKAAKAAAKAARG